MYTRARTEKAENTKRKDESDNFLVYHKYSKVKRCVLHECDSRYAAKLPQLRVTQQRFRFQF